MPNLRRPILCFAAGLLSGILALEIVLRFLPVNGKGIYGAEPTPAWPVHHLIPNNQYLYSMGWNFSDIRHGRINSLGYVAPFDYVLGSSGIVIVGDSFVESFMNDYSETIQGLLPDYLKQPMSVMQFGTSGAAMPDYLAVAGLIAEHFKAKWAVVVITGHDFDQGFHPSKGYYAWDAERNPPITLTASEKRSEFTQWVRQLALVRYLRGNLDATLKGLINFNDVADDGDISHRCKAVTLSTTDHYLVREFVKLLPARLSLDPSHVVLVFDSDRASLYAGASDTNPPCPTRNTEGLALLRSVALSEGVKVIDTMPLFQAYFERTGQRLDYSPVDKHWNGAAHRLVAQQVARVINGETNGRSD
jgi:hypothetical protein